MKIKRFRKRMKTDELNESSKYNEELKTVEEDNEWNLKEDEDKENDENESDFHENFYDP